MKLDKPDPVLVQLIGRLGDLECSMRDIDAEQAKVHEMINERRRYLHAQAEEAKAAAAAAKAAEVAPAPPTNE